MNDESFLQKLFRSDDGWDRGLISPWSGVRLSPLAFPFADRSTFWHKPVDNERRKFSPKAFRLWKFLLADTLRYFAAAWFYLCSRFFSSSATVGTPDRRAWINAG